jgi:hypothetical protein
LLRGLCQSQDVQQMQAIDSRNSVAFPIANLLSKFMSSRRTSSASKNPPVVERDPSIWRRISSFVRLLCELTFRSAVVIYLDIPPQARLARCVSVRV